MDSFQTDDGTRLSYRDEGEGLPLLALAGLTRNAHDFDYLSHHLPENTRLIRLDSRGRGQSDWTGPETYTVPQEAQDALALLDHLGVPRAAILGSSRGGLLGMMLAATARDRVLALCLNDVGPVLERDGLARIGQYIGVPPSVQTLTEVAERLPMAMPGFSGVPEFRWAEEAVRHYHMEGDRIALPYDPALRTAFDAAMAEPLPELWDLFDACAGLPLALIRGTGSDVLSSATAEEMLRRRPNMLYANVPGRGHIPFLDEPESLDVIHRWLAMAAAQESALVQGEHAS